MVLTHEGGRLLTQKEEALNPYRESDRERWLAWKNGFRDGERSEADAPPSYALSLGPVGEAYLAGWTAGELQAQ
jgi:hypothetical protein